MEEVKNLIELLKNGAAVFNAKLEDNHVAQFIEYKRLLLEWNEKMNLTAIEDDKDVIIKHFVDSLSIMPYLPNKPATLIDIGTGAGFPGIPLKVVRQDLTITLLDSLEKRIKFLEVVIQSLGLEGISTIHGRTEDFGIKVEYREKFDIAVARAVANLPVLLEYCLPYVKVGGTFIAMKGSNTDEAAQSGKALQVLGGEIAEIRELCLPDSEIKRNIFIIRKLRHTPSKYPRKAGKPSKEPLI